MLSEAIERMRRAREERVVLELTLLRLTELANLRPIAELIARLERLEDALCKEGITPESLPPAPSGPPDNHSRSASVGEGTRAPSPSPQNDAPSPPRSKARPAVPDRAPEQNKPNAAPEQNKPNAAPEQNSTQPAPEQSSSSEPETAVAAPAPQRPAPLEARAARARLEACWESLAESCDMGLARALRQCALGSVEVLNGQLSVTLRAPSLNALLRSTLEKALSGGELATKLSAQLDAPCHIRAELPKEASKERRPEADTTPSIVNHMREAFHARLLQQTDRGFGQG